MIGSLMWHSASFDLHDENVMRPLPCPCLTPLPSIVAPSEALERHSTSKPMLGTLRSIGPLFWSLTCRVPLRVTPLTCQKGPAADAADVADPLTARRASRPSKATLVFNIMTCISLLRLQPEYLWLDCLDALGVAVSKQKACRSDAYALPLRSPTGRIVKHTVKYRGLPGVVKPKKRRKHQAAQIPIRKCPRTLGFFSATSLASRKHGTLNVNWRTALFEALSEVGKAPGTLTPACAATQLA